jgi:hypothetical protein
MKKNIRIPRKKEEPEEPVILSQDYQPDMNSLKAIKQKN